MNASTLQPVTTGLPGLDDILDRLRIGDNVVWSVDDIQAYRSFVTPFVNAALHCGREIVYFRYGDHDPLVPDQPAVTRHDLNAYHGFENFTSSVHRRITQHGREAFCIFDALSDLLWAWATDQMVANFFRVICPYLFQRDTIAYFALLRGSHSFATVDQIRQTTQVMVGVYNRDQRQYVHPIKAWKRHSPTMFLPHEQRDDQFKPIANSYEATTLLSRVDQRSLDTPKRRLDYWDRLFLEAEAVAPLSDDNPVHQAMIDKLCRVMISQDERILELARQFFSLNDLLAIRSRMIGTGFIGGKAVGMLLARKMLQRDAAHDWDSVLEPHDSFFIGSDVFYWFLVHNGWWDLLMQQKTPQGYFTAAQHLGQLMLEGTLPDQITQSLRSMLEYFGQYPLVVRSSSLLEDGFSGAFAGKYESYFCVNQGSPEQRLARFIDAVCRIFASTMSRDALSYRRERGLENREEPMGLLVQRVAGRYHEHYYMPDLAGVGVSYNTFVWSNDMAPRAGMVRIVAGLGTRAVDRVENDYACTAALDEPLRRPYRDNDDARRYAQRDIDLLNIQANQLQSVPLLQLIRENVDLPYHQFAVPDRHAQQLMRHRGQGHTPAWLLTFEPLLARTRFPQLMYDLLKTLEGAYAYPVDIEFTLTYDADGNERINLVQCRPLQTRGSDQRVSLPEHVHPDNLLFRTHGHFMGGTVQLALQRVIRVDPQAYAQLTTADRHALARVIGQLNQMIPARDTHPTLLIGPGRWGTSTPTLGVPVRYADINHMAAIIEMADESAGMTPELSYGTHFFQDLVEANTFYAALTLGRAGCHVNTQHLRRYDNVLATLLPEAEPFAHVLQVHDIPAGRLNLLADVVAQQALCYQPENND